MITVTRRQFLKSSAAVVAFEFALTSAAHAQAASTPEVTHWIVVYPDDRVVIRIARSEICLLYTSDAADE